MAFGWNINEYLDPENNDIDELLFLILFFLLIEHSSVGRIDAEKLYCILMIAIIVLLFVDLKEELKEKSNVDKISTFKKYVVQKTRELFKNKSLHKTKNTFTDTTKRQYFSTAVRFRQYNKTSQPLKEIRQMTCRYAITLNRFEAETTKFTSYFSKVLYKIVPGLTAYVETTNLQKKLYFINFWPSRRIIFYILTNVGILKRKYSENIYV